MTDQPEPVRPVWIVGDPTMEAIAASVWEQCQHSESGLAVLDDPRNIAAVVAAVRTAAGQPHNRAALRDRIAEALRPGSRDRGGHYPEGLMRDADAVLAVLPEPADRAAAPSDEDFLVAVEEALESTLLPSSGVAVLERSRDAVLSVLAPLVAQLRAVPADQAAVLREADEAQQPTTAGEQPDTRPTPCGQPEPHRPHRFMRGRAVSHCPGCESVPDTERRGRYLEAIRYGVNSTGPWGPEMDAAADAALAVADEEQRGLRRDHAEDSSQLAEMRATIIRLRAELEQDAAITKEVMDRADKDMEGARETARYFKALAEQAQAWGEQHRDRANRYRTRTDAVTAECRALNSETKGLNPFAMAGRRDAVARIRAALQTIRHDTPVPDDPRVTALESENIRLRAGLEQARTTTQPGPVSEDGAQQ
ncbi:hypothetical protein [Streptomyces sp. NPDC058280]|uniref:hypothetical protein n=1 Tax=Streptomyces sp. NPDC058280 TaxID=3346419 RepID=UPI0036E4E7CC